MIETFYYIKRLADQFEKTKKNINDHIEKLLTLEEEVKSYGESEKQASLSEEIRVLSEKIQEHRGVFGIAFFTLGLAYAPSLNRLHSEKHKTYKMRKVPIPPPAEDSSCALQHYFMTFFEHAVMMSDWILWILASGSSIYSFWIDDSEDAYYDDMNQPFQDFKLSTREGQQRLVFIQ